MALNHHREGSGEPLVLIHGTGNHWQYWRPLIDRLAPRRELVAVDLPGFGDSPPLPGGAEPSPEELAAAVASFLDEQGLERPAIAGHSLGGWIALELAKRGRARSVVAIAPSGFWTPREAAWCRGVLRLAALIARTGDEALAKRFDSAAVRTLLFWPLWGQPWRMPPEEMRALWRAYGHAPGLDATIAVQTSRRFTDPAAVRVPVTLLWGDRDPLLFPREGRRAARVLDGARLVWLRRAGHMVFRDDPEPIAEALAAA